MKRSDIESAAREFANKHTDEILEEVQCDSMTGFCVLCGDTAGYAVEGDARGYRCGACEEPSVYAAEELLFYASV